MLRALVVSITLMALPLVTGCGGGSNPTSGGAGGLPAGRMLKGSLHGGQSPICNSTVGLYPAGAVGPCATTTTDAQGAFNIDPSDPSNTCGSTPADKQMYIVATGGVANNNDCGPGGGNNTALAMSTALGRFDSLPGFVVINEVTTVASVWALNQFLDTSGQNLSDPVTNQGGLANA